MKFSVFTASTPDWEPQEIARRAAELGYDGIEWRIKDQEDAETPGFWVGNRSTIPFTGILENAQNVRQLSESVGLQVSGLGGYQHASDHDNALIMMQAAAAIGAPQVRLTMENLGPERGASDRRHGREMVEATRKDLAWAVERAKDLGIKVLVETHHRTIAASASGALRLIEGLDPEHIGVIHDSGNMNIEGREDYLFGFQILGEYLAHVHVKNSFWIQDEDPEQAPTDFVSHETTYPTQAWRPRHTSVWKGIADLDSYFEGLAAVAYRGWLTLEDFSTDEPLTDRLEHNLAYVRALAARHGL